MTLEQNYTGDSEFAKLLAHETDIDLTLVALEIARDAYPTLDFQPTLAWIQERVEQLIPVLSAAATEQEALRLLAHCLSRQHRLRGTPDAYSQAESSYLNRVVETGQGIPISLSLVYMAVGRHLHLDLWGVATPLHFLSVCETAGGPLYLDAFRNGIILTERECLQRIQQLSGLSCEQITRTLVRAEPRAIVIRLLNNLKFLYTHQQDWLAAWMVQHRLSALKPTDFQEQRDLALISLRAGRPGTAVDTLQFCLNYCTQEEKPSLETCLKRAETLLARWN